MALTLVACSRAPVASADNVTAARKRAGQPKRPGGTRIPAAVQTVLQPAPALVAVADSQAALAALAQLPRHPSQLQPANLVPALRSLLLSLSGSCSWEPAVLASPLLVGLLSWAVQLLEQPRAAAALGPEAPLLVLEALSHLSRAAQGPGSRQADHCRSLWRHAHCAFGDAADDAGRWELVNPELLSPEMIVRYYEACARGAALVAAPSKSNGLGLLLRGHLTNNRFSADEAVRLLAAWAELRAALPFNPDPTNFARLSTTLTCAAPQLTSAQLEAVAAAAPAFHWPVFRSMPLLHAVCREAVHRSLAGAMALPAAQRTLAAAVKGVAAMHPCLAHDLQAATIEWMRDAPLERPIPQQQPAEAATAVAADVHNNALPCKTGPHAPLANAAPA